MLKIGDNKIKISWWDLDDITDELCKGILEKTPLIDSVMGIPRGGLIPATLISHKLSLPYVNVIGKNTLVVDDICDSGVTLKNSPGVYHAVLHYKPHTSCFIPDVYARLHEGDEWLIYPWEEFDSPAMQDYLNTKTK